MYSKKITYEQAVNLLPETFQIRFFRNTIGGYFVSSYFARQLLFSSKEFIRIPDEKFDTISGIYLENHDLYIQTDRDKLKAIL